MAQDLINELNKMTDEELTYLVKKSDNLAFEVITNRYLQLISFVASKYRETPSNLSYAHEDFVQEGLLGLLSACKTYDKNKEASFKNYAFVCIENRLKTITNRLSKKSTIPNISLLPIDNSIEKITDNTSSTLQENFESKESIQAMYKTLNEKLSDMEYKVVTLYLSGMSYKEIAKELSITDKAVDNAIQRVHKKLSC